jgi:hypothetical protein
MAPPRREQRKIHLDASVVPVERALLARAEELEQEDDPIKFLSAPELMSAFVAAEFRALAEELHWWL